MIKRLFQQRYGIAARKVGVRSEWNWYWRFLFWGALFSVSLAAAGWVYDAGRRIAGFDRQASERELTEMTERLKALEQQLAKAQEQARAGEGRLNVETAALDQLAAQLKNVQKENIALKEELALFEGLVSGRAASGPVAVRVPRASIERTGGGKYRYRVMLVHQPAQKGGRDFNGEFRFELRVRAAGRDVMIPIPGEGAGVAASFKLSFRHIHRAEGEFALPDGAELISADLYLTQGGGVLVKQPVAL